MPSRSPTAPAAAPAAPAVPPDVAAPPAGTHTPTPAAAPVAPPITRVIAVDWSGAADPRRTMWLAAHEARGLVQLTAGFTHAAIVGVLTDAVTTARAAGEGLVLGLDFAFGFPARFAERRGLAHIDEVWALAAAEGERWRRCEVPPFWGRAGCGATRADGWGGPRDTDAEVRARGLGHPKSPYQVTGAGAVGSSTIRGMPVLRALRAAGAAIWPFDPPGAVTVIECYPRLATGAVVKRDAAARRAWLATHVPRASGKAIPAAMRRAAIAQEDAFDALAAARWLWRHREAVRATPWPTPASWQREGAIWMPPDDAAHSGR